MEAANQENSEPRGTGAVGGAIGAVFGTVLGFDLPGATPGLHAPPARGRSTLLESKKATGSDFADLTPL